MWQKLDDFKSFFVLAWEFIKEWASWISEKLHLAYFAEVICSKIHDHVDHFHPSDLELGSQNLELRTCAADTIGF